MRYRGGGGVMKREEFGLRAFPMFLRVKLNALYLFKSHLLRDHIDQEGGGGGGDICIFAHKYAYVRI